MKHYLIYQIRNKLNGMIYIGQHQTENIDDGYMGSGIRIKYAIEKYGIENFEKTILFECTSVEEMNAKEAEIVNEEFIARDDVYNIKLGGEGGWDYVNSIGLNHSGNFLPIDQQCKKYFQKYGHYPTTGWANRMKQTNPEKFEKLKTNFSQRMKKFFSENGHPWLGKHHTNETKLKISNSKRGKNTGEKSSQFGTIWICNDETFESKKIKKTDEIPVGWRKGRYCNKHIN